MAQLRLPDAETPASACRQLIEYRRRIHQYTGRALIGGFGLVREKKEGEGDPDVFDECRTKDVFWPLGQDEQIISIVDDEKWCPHVESVVGQIVALRGEDASDIFWRALPTWTHERQFDRNRTLYKLHLRCAFVWIP